MRNVQKCNRCKTQNGRSAAPLLWRRRVKCGPANVRVNRGPKFADRSNYQKFTWRIYALSECLLVCACCLWPWLVMYFRHGVLSPTALAQSPARSTHSEATPWENAWGQPLPQTYLVMPTSTKLLTSVKTHHNLQIVMLQKLRERFRCPPPCLHPTTAE